MYAYTQSPHWINVVSSNGVVGRGEADWCGTSPCKQPTNTVCSAENRRTRNPYRTGACLLPRFTAAQLHLHCLPGRIEVHKHNLSVSRCVVTRTALSRNHLRKGHVHRAPSHGVVQFVFFSVSMFCMRMGASALNATPKYVAIMTQVIKSSVDTLVSLPV